MRCACVPEQRKPWKAPLNNNLLEPDAAAVKHRLQSLTGWAHTVAATAGGDGLVSGPPGALPAAARLDWGSHTGPARAAPVVAGPCAGRAFADGAPGVAHAAVAPPVVPPGWAWVDDWRPVVNRPPVIAADADRIVVEAPPGVVAVTSTDGVEGGALARRVPVSISLTGIGSKPARRSAREGGRV